MNKITRGTTPSFILSLGEHDLNDFAEIWVTIAQPGKLTIEKTLTDGTLHDGKLLIWLTQEESLRLEVGARTQYQARWKFENGSADATDIIETTVAQILKDGVI